MKSIIAIIIITLFSCAGPKSLHQTGSYTIASTSKEKEGTQVQLHGVKGKYLLLSDTLKVGDTVRINVIAYSRKRKS